MEDNKVKKIEDNIADIGLGSKKPDQDKSSREEKRKLFSSKKQGSQRERRGPRSRRFQRQKKSPFSEEVVHINRVSKTTKGGRKISFNALVVIGDRKGHVGYALGKAAEVPTAIKKAIKKAEKNLISVPLTKTKTIPHSIIGKAGSGQVFLRNAPKGTGVIAGSGTRLVLELAGVQNIYSKVQGSKTKINVVRATFDALQNLHLAPQVALLRDKEVKELL